MNFLADNITRRRLGLPAEWHVVQGWIEDSKVVAESVPEVDTLFDVKNPEIPVLKSYEKDPGKNFWKIFPKFYPEKPEASVKKGKLQSYIQKCWFSWTRAQKGTALKAMRRVAGKEKVILKHELKEIKVKNAKSAFENGLHMTDAICGWVKKKFVAGPFKKAPLRSFRVNPLMAAVQKTKVRPIMNLSSPKGRSFNDAVDDFSLEKLKMSTPKKFAESIVKCGEGAVIAKSDIKDAYKLIPNAMEQWRLYGFEWLGKTFFDSRTVFGSKAAPAHFDALPETIVNVVCCLEDIPKKYVHRQLDDVPVVSPKGSGLTERFVKKYDEVCQKLGVPLAEECPNHEKSFGPSTFGTVLGINFDTSLMEWSISAEKESSLQKTIDEFLAKKVCSLKEVQKLLGKLANFAQMSDFLRSYKFNILWLLRKFDGLETERKLISQELKDDLWVWKKVISEARNGIPIRDIFDEPPLFPKTYVSDAAGAAFEWENGTCKNVTEKGDRGVASVGHMDGKVKSVALLRWPEKLLTCAKNRNGKFFGSLSGTLEAVGLLLPFLTEPKVLRGQHVLLEVDNNSVVYAWEKKHGKIDFELTLLIRCLVILENVSGMQNL